MAFIKTVPEENAENLVHEQYQTARESMGYVPNYMKVFSIHPEVYEAWTKLLGAIRSSMRLRRYELVTFATALALECTYCSLAHGAVLRKNFFNAEQLISIVKDFRNAELSPEEVALMTFTQKITARANQVNEKDMEQLRGFGLTDEEILNVVLACTARNFFSKTLDSLAAVPDEVYKELEPELVKVLTVGRSFPLSLVKG
jgi:uncharacterized peroxidase-related enzyme